MKRYRYNKIKEIVQSKAIETQEELAAALLQEGIDSSLCYFYAFL